MHSLKFGKQLQHTEQKSTSMVAHIQLGQNFPELCGERMWMIKKIGKVFLCFTLLPLALLPRADSAPRGPRGCFLTNVLKNALIWHQQFTKVFLICYGKKKYRVWLTEAWLGQLQWEVITCHLFSRVKPIHTCVEGQFSIGLSFFCCVSLVNRGIDCFCLALSFIRMFI